MDRPQHTRDGAAEAGEPLIIYLGPNDTREVSSFSPEGEIRGVAAFADGFSSASPVRRTTARGVVWLILIGMAISVLVAVTEGIRG